MSFQRYRVDSCHHDFKFKAMLKYFTNLISNPKMLLLESSIGAMLIHYVENLVVDSLKFIIPTLFVIVADLVWGIQAAQGRKERVTFSTAFRRTFNKVLGYSCWILFSVAMGLTYNYEMLPLIMMALVFIIEGSSCVNNVLEKSNKQISITGLLKLIGRKTNHEGLEDIIEKKDNNQ